MTIQQQQKADSQVRCEQLKRAEQEYLVVLESSLHPTTDYFASIIRNVTALVLWFERKS